MIEHRTTVVSKARGQQKTGALLALAIVSARMMSAHAAAPPRYTVDTNNKTVNDARTALTWQRNVSSSTMTWDAASTACQSPWRLPSYKELMTLVDRSLTAGPAIDRTTFPNTPAAKFWSGTKYAMDTTLSWFVDFTDGVGEKETTDNTHYVRCVK